MRPPKMFRVLLLLCLLVSGPVLAQTALPISIPNGSGFPADVLGTGTINSATSNATYGVALANGEAVVGFSIAGLTASGATLTVEGNVNGGAYQAINEVFANGGYGATLTADGNYYFNAGARSNVRLRVSATGTGTITVTSLASSASSRVTAQTPIQAPLSGLVTNPTSTLTRPNNTTAYAVGQLIASNTAHSSVVVPAFAIANAAGAACFGRLRLTTNATTGWGSVGIQVNLWTTAPTYTNGDGGTYAVATGAAGFLASFPITLTQFGDGASGNGVPAVGNNVCAHLASGTAIYWDAQVTSGTPTPIADQTFTVAPEALN